MQLETITLGLTVLINVFGAKVLNDLIRHGVQQGVVRYENITIRDHPHVQGSQ